MKVRLHGGKMNETLRVPAAQLSREGGEVTRALKVEQSAAIWRGAPNHEAAAHPATILPHNAHFRDNIR